MMSDLDLLDQYVREHRQEAFAALVDRHLRLVYSAALRQVRSPELAEEVAQSVFADLARNAGRMEPQTILSAWLYQVTRRTAINVVRGESRRQLREQIALDLANMNADTPDWTAIEPLLDAAMEALDPPDRTAILLRYFEDKSLREVGQALGTSEDAAQKRVSRALDQLREFFSRRGRAVGVGGLAALISANAVQSAPASLQTAILTSAACSGTGAPIAGTIGISKALTMTTLQKALVGMILAAAVGSSLYQAQRAASLQEEVQTLHLQSAPANEQNESLHQQLEEANHRLAALQTQNEKLRKDAADLLRLRGELSRLKSNPPPSNNDPAASAAKSWLARVSQLKERLQQTAGAKIPEFQFLTEQDWLNAAKGDLNTEEDYRKAMSRLRDAAEGAFIKNSLQPALNQFEQANQGQFPASIAQLQPYFNPPVDDSILQRWVVAPQATVPSLGLGATIITQTAPVDADYDTRFGIGLNGSGSAGPQDWDAQGTGSAALLMPAIKAYAAANNGLPPKDLSQLAPYLTTPEEQAALQQAIKRSSR